MTKYVENQLAKLPRYIQNGLDSYALAPHSNVIKVEDTSHCHFEFPVDGKCSLVCGKGEKRFSREVIQQTIVGLTTAFLLWQTGIDPNGETWWSDSQLNYKILRDAGYIKKPITDGTGFNSEKLPKLVQISSAYQEF